MIVPSFTWTHVQESLRTLQIYFCQTFSLVIFMGLLLS
jgi:hypothetical protein